MAKRMRMKRYRKRKSYRRKRSYRRYRRRSRAEVKYAGETFYAYNYYGGQRGAATKFLPSAANWTVLPTNNANPGQFNFWNGLIQGTSKHNRIGDTIFGKFIRIHITLSPNRYPNQCVRCIIFTAPTGTNINNLEFFHLSTKNPGYKAAMINREVVHQVLYDKVWQFNDKDYTGWNTTSASFDRSIGYQASRLSDYTPMYHKTIKIRVNREINFKGTNSANTAALVKEAKDNIYFAMWGSASPQNAVDEATPMGTFDFTLRLYYTDS